MERPELDDWLKRSGELLGEIDREALDKKLADEAKRDEELGVIEDRMGEVATRQELDEIDWILRHPDDIIE